jgi:hypothetical protein
VPLFFRFDFVIFVTAEDGEQPFWLEPCKQVTIYKSVPLCRWFVMVYPPPGVKILS